MALHSFVNILKYHLISALYICKFQNNVFYIHKYRDIQEIATNDGIQQAFILEVDSI